MYEYRATYVKTIDGDTFDCLVDLGFGVSYSLRIRLGVVDTPERGALGWADAKQTTQEWLEAHPKFLLRTQKDASGGFGRYLGWVFSLEDERDNLIDLLLSKGYAKYSRA